MSDSFNYNFFNTLSDRSLDIIDTKTLVTYGMIGVTCVVLAVATLYDEIEEEASTDMEEPEELKPEEEPTTGGKKSNKSNKKLNKKRKTKRKYKN